VLSCMTSVLIIVAVLQYRWTKQLSVTSEARLTTHLQPLMIGWHLDFYGELSAICVALHVGPDSARAMAGMTTFIATSTGTTLRSILSRWRTSMQIRACKKHLRLANVPQGDPRLLRLDPGAARLNPLVYPKIYSRCWPGCKQNRQVYLSDTCLGIRWLISDELSRTTKRIHLGFTANRSNGRMAV